MKMILAALLASCMLSVPVLAQADCESELTEIGSLMTSMDSQVADADMGYVISLYSEAKAACTAGDEETTAVKIAELRQFVGY